MRHLGMFLVLGAAAMNLTGCGQMNWSSSTAGTGAKGGIAVVDLDRVAAETGRDRQLAQSVKMAESSLNQALAKTVESAQVQLEAQKKKYGEEMSDDQKKEFAEMEKSAITQLSQIQNQARVKYEQFKQNEIAQFRAELKPIAHEVAAKRGLSVVVPKNEGLLLSIDPGVDITDDVIKAMREKHPTAPQTAAQPVDDDAPAASTAKRTPAPAKSAGKSRTAAKDKDDDANATR